MNVYLLGAGASRGYSNPKTKIPMPLARDFFTAFFSLKISESPYVLIGSIINYLHETRNIAPENFYKFNDDIEDIHSEINDKLNGLLKAGKKLNDPELVMLYKANNELVFLFNCVINEVQNGDISETHKNFVRNLQEDDSIITFNWDTLLDRALSECHGTWKVDFGYGIKPKSIYRDKWTTPDDINAKCPSLIKLHGSTNWITSYSQIKGDEIRLMKEIAKSEYYVYESCTKPFPTYRGRFFPDYESFSYGYYPPNIPEDYHAPKGYTIVSITPNYDFRIKDNPNADASGLVSMPLIIPPIKSKEYDLFGDLFTDLWAKAQDVISVADNIFIIGYSFPKTDIKSIDLFRKAFNNRTTMPNIIIISPSPDDLVSLFKNTFGVNDKHLLVQKECFSKDFDANKILKSFH